MKGRDKQIYKLYNGIHLEFSDKGDRRMKILFADIEWMKYYVGEGDDEKPTPLCGYNFQYINGYYYGYGENMNTIPLEKLEGVLASDSQADDVLVVWTSTNKKNEKVIIGWYKHATVYRTSIHKYTLDSERIEINYSIKTRAENALLLPMEERGYGVSCGDSGIYFEEDKLICSTVAAYIHNYGGDQMNLVLNEKDIQRALVIPMDYEQCFRKADEFLAKDLYAKAIKCFNKAIAEEPEETLGYECKGSVLLSLKMYDLALENYEKVAMLDDDNALAHYCLGLLYGLKEEYKKAMVYYDHYLIKRPQDMHAVCERGIVLYQLGYKTQGQQAFLEAHKAEPDNVLFKKVIEKLGAK